MLFWIYVWHKLIVKAAFCNEGAEKSVENILILQNSTATSHHNTNSAETKQSFYVTCYKFHVQPVIVYKLPASIVRGGGGFRKGGDIRHISSTVWWDGRVSGLPSEDIWCRGLQWNVGLDEYEAVRSDIMKKCKTGLFAGRFCFVVCEEGDFRKLCRDGIMKGDGDEGRRGHWGWSLGWMLLVLPSLKTMYWMITWGSVIDIASRFDSSVVCMRVRRPMHTASCSVARNLYFLSSAVLCYMGWMWPLWRGMKT